MTALQEPIAQLLHRLGGQQTLQPRSTSARTLIGLVGRGIQLSRSPTMHEREGARLGLDYCYVLVDFDALGLADGALAEVVAAAEQAGFAGLNVTHPFKQAIIPLLTSLSAEAEAIGAVNTVVFSGRERTGHNTDSWGFEASFRDSMTGCDLDRVVQFGAGGAGAAVAHALLKLGAEQVILVDSDAGRAQQLAESMMQRASGAGVLASSGIEAALAEATGIVNTTPVGMAKYPGTPFPADLLRPSQWVADIIYFPQQTELLRLAQAIGCRTLPGTGMAVYQAVRAFELFTGIAPDPQAMVRHFEAAA